MGSSVITAYLLLAICNCNLQSRVNARVGYYVLLVYLNYFYMTTWITVAEAWDSRHTIVLLSDLCTCLFASVSKHHMYSVYKCVIHSGVFLKVTCSSLPNKVFHKCSCLIGAERYICNRITTTVTIEYLIKQQTRQWLTRYVEACKHFTHTQPTIVLVL